MVWSAAGKDELRFLSDRCIPSKPLDILHSQSRLAFLLRLHSVSGDTFLSSSQTIPARPVATSLSSAGDRADLAGTRGTACVASALLSAASERDTVVAFESGGDRKGFVDAFSFGRSVASSFRRSGELCGRGRDTFRTNSVSSGFVIVPWALANNDGVTPVLPVPGMFLSLWGAVTMHPNVSSKVMQSRPKEATTHPKQKRLARDHPLVLRHFLDQTWRLRSRCKMVHSIGAHSYSIVTVDGSVVIPTDLSSSRRSEHTARRVSQFRGIVFCFKKFFWITSHGPPHRIAHYHERSTPFYRSVLLLLLLVQLCTAALRSPIIAMVDSP
jgi:hypothetical protein